MTRTRAAGPRRARRVGAGLMAAAILLLSGGIVVYGPAEPAAATPVEIVSPLEYTPIIDRIQTFTGTANPFEEITVQVTFGSGIPCTDVADGAGNWACDVTFTATADVMLVQAISFDHVTPDQDEDSQEYPVTLPPEVTDTPQTPGVIVTNQNLNPSFSGVADPGADIEGTIGGLPCADTADGAGAYTCTAAGALGADGDYPITVNQLPTWGIDPDNRSVDEPAVYRLDTVTSIPDFSYPYDTIGPGANETTSDRTPLVGGDIGTAEPFGTVDVWADNFGAVPPDWVGVPTDPGSFFCSATADASGAWSCSPAFQLPIGSVWVFGSTQQDLAGNATGGPDAEFSLQILPPPPPPTILEPVIGYAIEATRVHVSTTNLAEGTMYVRMGGTNVCPPTPVGVPTFSCDTVPLSPGVHTLSVLQEDAHGTLSAPAQRLVTILAPPVPPALALKTLSFTFRILNAAGEEVGENGLSAGEQATIVATGLPAGTEISAEIHSTPVALGGTTIGSSGLLELPVTVPEVEAGAHEIVISANAPGYEPAVVTSPVQVREVKQIPE